MTKIKITAQQYNTILLRESKTRLKAQESIITENLNEDTQLLEEGWKEVVLGIAMMMGVGLTGLNKATAQTAVKNAETMAQIKATLEDESKINQVVDLLKQKGMKDPETKLAQNAEKVMDQYNEIAADDGIKYRVDVKVVNNLQQLKGNIGQGYALKTADMTTDTVKTEAKIPVMVTDTMEVDLGSDNLFVTGGFTLSPAGIDTISMAINEIKKQGGKIESVDVESSTDAEEVVKFKTAQDPTGNIQLSNLRTQSVVNELAKLGVTENITHREIPNNGSNVVTTQDFLKVAKDKKATEALRKKTSGFRYVKIKIVATFEAPEDKPAEDAPTLIKNYRFELVKVIESTGKTTKINTKVHFKQKKFKCKTKHGKNNVAKCATF